MTRFDPLDWTHQWDDYEMYMYVDVDSDREQDRGVRMQVLQRSLLQGAEEWTLLYDRRLAPLPAEDTQGEWNDQEEERVLREFLLATPQLVSHEKEVLSQFQQDGRLPSEGGSD